MRTSQATLHEFNLFFIVDKSKKCHCNYALYMHKANITKLLSAGRWLEDTPLRNGISQPLYC